MNYNLNKNASNQNKSDDFFTGNVSQSCICCAKEIRKIAGLKKDKDWEGMWGGGIVERISAGYGSLLDGDVYILAICDDCVKLKNLKRV